MLKTERFLDVLKLIEYLDIKSMVKNISQIASVESRKKNVIVIFDSSDKYNILISKKKNGYYGIKTYEKQGSLIL